MLNLQSGDERSDVDMQMRLRRTQRVSGTVSGPDGPLKHVGVRLMPAGAEELGLGGSSFTAIDAGSTVTDASGNFTFLGIAPGAYSLQVVRVPRTVAPRSASSTTTIEMAGGAGMIMMSSGGPLTAPLLPLPTDPTLWGGATVNVGEADVNNVSVVLRPGARLSGKIVFEGSGTPPPPDILQRTGIQMTSLTGSSPSPVAGAQKRVETDGRFATVGYPPGRYSVFAWIPVQPQAKDATVWRFRSATLNGRDLADEGLEIEQNRHRRPGAHLHRQVDRSLPARSPTEEPAGFECVGGGDSGRHAGLAAKHRDASPCAECAPGTGGGYSFRDLPPGEYFIGAVSDAARQ